MTNVDKKAYSLQGCYAKKGNTLIKTGGEGLQKLYLKTRANPTKKKPKHFLLAPGKGKAVEYISSIYPTSISGKYSLEYNQYNYLLYTNGDQYTITISE